MLKSLQIRNYVLIDSLDITFPAGLVIITGQTGAGKSIILGALSLLLGARADTSQIAEGADSCMVEALFDVAGQPGAEALIRENDLAWEGGRLIIRRVLNRTGRSRSFINDEPVSAAVLSRLSASLVDIHNQRDTALLRDRGFQLSLLDRYAGNEALLDAAQTVWKRLGTSRKRLEAVSRDLQRMTLEKDYNEAMARQLGEARLREGELEELEAEQKRLAHAEDIRQSLYAVESLLGAARGDASPVPALLKEASRSLSRAVRFLPVAEDLAARLESVRIELEDILEEVVRAGEATQVSPQRLATVEDRLSLLYGLLQKHACRTVGDLLALKEELAGRLTGWEDLAAEKDRLEKEIGADAAALEDIALRLHRAREAVLDGFAAEVRASLRELELERAVFAVTLQAAPLSATGRDEAVYLFSAAGQDPVDVKACASGGEASRIMLSLKAMSARFSRMPSLVFDEIDTGVSGSAADKMGSMICRMGRDMQVFAVTHLPQVAAKGDAHYLVSKETLPGGKEVTTISPLTGEARVREIARMLSGASVTPEALANARVLIGESLT